MTTAPVFGQSDVKDIVRRFAASSPTSTALMTIDASYTFQQLADAVHRIAGKLVPGSRVLIRLGNNAASVAAIHGAWAAGCSVVSASTMVPASEVTRRVSETAASSVLTPGGAGLQVAVEHTDVQRPAPSGEAVVMFTSGTTGVPKGASLTFAALRGSVAGIAGGSGIPADGRPPRVPARSPQMVLVPIAHMGGFLSVLSSWWLGKPVLLCGKFSPELVFDLARRYRLGVLRATPAMIWELAQWQGADQLTGITSATVGTAALPEATRLAFEAKFSIPVLRNYGQTEFAGAIAFERPDDVAAGRRPDNTVGRVAPGVEVAILDADGRHLPNGHVGEITARAASAMSGYLDADGHPDDPGSWLKTGDLGTLDEDGFVYVVGRVRDMIVCGGFNVYPAQVEAALNRLDEVADSAVAGIEDDRLGEIPVAAVILNPGAVATVDTIRERLRTQLAAYELPRRVLITESIPRLDTGKVDRPGVARLFERSPS